MSTLVRTPEEQAVMDVLTGAGHPMTPRQLLDGLRERSEFSGNRLMEALSRLIDEEAVVFNSSLQDLNVDLSVYDDSAFFEFNKSFTYGNSQALVYEVFNNNYCTKSISLPFFPPLTLKDLLKQ